MGFHARAAHTATHPLNGARIDAWTRSFRAQLPRKHNGLGVAAPHAERSCLPKALVCALLPVISAADAGRGVVNSQCQRNSPLLLLKPAMRRTTAGIFLLMNEQACAG